MKQSGGDPTIPVSNTNEKSYYHEQSKLLCNTTVIFVDDDPDTLKRAANILRDIGFETIESDSYSRALEQIGHLKGTAILFTDLHLGANKNGWDLARRMLEANPSTPIVVTSGRGVDLNSSPQDLADRIELLTKPYSMETIARLLTKLSTTDL